jgi:hypothetical protein
MSLYSGNCYITFGKSYIIHTLSMQFLFLNPTKALKLYNKRHYAKGICRRHPFGTFGRAIACPPTDGNQAKIMYHNDLRIH